MVGQSFCKNLVADDHDAATRDALELMSDMQPYSDNEALTTFAVWVAAQPCAKNVTLSSYEIYTDPGIREVGFIVEGRGGDRKACIADFRLRAPWIVTFHRCERV